MSKPPPSKEGGTGKRGLGRYFRRFSSALRRGSSSRDAETTSRDLPIASSTKRSRSPSQRLSPVPSRRSEKERDDGTAARPQTSTSGGDGAHEQESARSARQSLLLATPSSDPMANFAPRPLGESRPGLYPTDTRRPSSYEKIKSMFARYNIPFDDSSIPPQRADGIVRVEKPIRMRVRIICHVCGNHSSSSKRCPTCDHQRCRECRRWPEKKSKEKMDKGKGKMRQPDTIRRGNAPSQMVLARARDRTAEAGLASTDEDESEGRRVLQGQGIVPKRPKRKKQPLLTMPSRRGGQDLIRKPPEQRTHRFCCKCQRPFARRTKLCDGCKHWCCTQCPRDPAKLDKWPDGYPGDVIPAKATLMPSRQWKKPRIRIRWTCHVCRTLFVEGEKICAGCSHPRCAECHREPPRREVIPPDPVVVQAVEEKLTSVPASS